MRAYAVIDTKVLVSSLLSRNGDAATVQVVRRALVGDIVPVYSAEVMDEYREVLSRPKFRLNAETVSYLLRAIERFGMLVETEPSGAVLPDMKDVPFYEVAMETRDEGSYLVTGNGRHFPNVPFVVTPREMLDILDAANQLPQ
jgi:putative PIN family toxin of toxin-antitoxin system